MGVHRLHIDTTRDRLCMATSARVNEERVVIGTKPVSNKSTSVRPDLVLVKNGVEYGVSESGKKDEAAMTKKELIETQLLCPNTMKDMFDRAASKLDGKQALVHELRIVCMNQTGFRFRLSVMDCPAGYVCRMTSSKESISSINFKFQFIEASASASESPMETLQSSCSSLHDSIETATHLRADLTGKVYRAFKHTLIENHLKISHPLHRILHSNARPSSRFHMR